MQPQSFWRGLKYLRLFSVQNKLALAKEGKENQSPPAGLFARALRAGTTSACAGQQLQGVSIGHGCDETERNRRSL